MEQSREEDARLLRQEVEERTKRLKEKEKELERRETEIKKQEVSGFLCEILIHCTVPVIGTVALLNSFAFKFSGRS